MNNNNKLFPNNKDVTELLQNLHDVQKEPWQKAVLTLTSIEDLNLLKAFLAKELNTGRLYSHKAFYWLDDIIGDHKQTLLMKEKEQTEIDRAALEALFKNTSGQEAA